MREEDGYIVFQGGVSEKVCVIVYGDKGKVWIGKRGVCAVGGKEVTVVIFTTFAAFKGEFVGDEIRVIESWVCSEEVESTPIETTQKDFQVAFLYTIEERNVRDC